MSNTTPAPLPPLVALHFDLRPRTEHDPPSDHAIVAECHFQRAGEPLTTFDAEQLPDLAKAILGEVVVTQAATLTTQAQQLAAQAAELKAKDDNAQILLEEKNRLQIVVDAFHAEVQPVDQPTK